MTTAEPVVGALIDGRYRLIECMEASGVAGAERCSTWRANDEQTHRDVRVDIVSAPADSEGMLVSRCLSPAAVLDAGDWDAAGVFLVTALTEPATVAKARRRRFARTRVQLSPVTARPA